MRWIALGQWPEPAYRSLMTAYASSGDVSKAMATYERFSQGLYNDLGVAPSEQTQTLYRRLKSGWKSENKATPVRPAEPTAQPSARQPTAGPLLRACPLKLTQPDDELHRSRKGNPASPRTGSQSAAGHHRRHGRGGQDPAGNRGARPMVERFRDGVRWVELAALSVITATKQKGSNAQPGKKTDSPEPIGRPGGRERLYAYPRRLACRS